MTCALLLELRIKGGSGWAAALRDRQRKGTWPEPPVASCSLCSKRSYTRGATWGPSGPSTWLPVLTLQAGLPRVRSLQVTAPTQERPGPQRPGPATAEEACAPPGPGGWAGVRLAANLPSRSTSSGRRGRASKGPGGRGGGPDEPSFEQRIPCAFRHPSVSEHLQARDWCTRDWCLCRGKKDASYFN